MHYIAIIHKSNAVQVAGSCYLQVYVGSVSSTTLLQRNPQVLRVEMLTNTLSQVAETQ